MNIETLNRWQKSLQTRSSLAIIVTAAILIELTVAIQYWYAKRGIEEEVVRRAKSELTVESLEIQNVMTSVEVGVKNHVWVIESMLEYPDSMYTIEYRIVHENEQIWGCGIAFIPDYYPSKGKWFEPYTSLNLGEKIVKTQIGGPNHDYTKLEFYKHSLEGDSAFWSEPYLDPDGARGMVTTFSMPVHDKTGRVVAVVGADVALDWLSDVVDANNAYESSYEMIISRNGLLMASPVESLVMQRTIHDIELGKEDTSLSRFNEQMKSGKHGQTILTDENGVKNYVFFAPIKGNTGWSMAVVCPDKEIYASLRKVGLYLTLLMLAGLALLTLIVVRTIHGFKKLQRANADKESIDKELHIANAIQMGMLPKVHSHYPDSDDIEVYGSLVPAKVVGGDLYDFFIRDEKLFFCIGDVSGKGVPASLVMSVTRTLFRTLSNHETLPDRIVDRLNDTMAEMNETNMFATIFVGVLHIPTGKLQYCNAGHCPPLLIGNGVSKLNVIPNIPVGFMAGKKFVSQEIMIEPETTIFLYTDGLTEAENSSHAQFGVKRVVNEAERIIANGNINPSELIKQMSDAMHEFVSGNEQSDDLTMLAVKYTKQQDTKELRRNIVLPNDVETITKLHPFIEEIGEKLELSSSLTMKLNLAVEEAVVNVMNYAYPEGTYGEVAIDAMADDKQLQIILTDCGVAFDPTESKEADTTLSADERPIGGLGIHLVRQIMDSVSYERTNDKNVLTLVKVL